MPLNRDFVGRTWHSPEIYEVSRERLRDYAIAIDDLQPGYLDDDAAREQGHEAIVAPPTFATTLWFRTGVWPLSDPALGKRKEPWCLLGEQSLTLHRPIVVGDRLRFATTVRDIRTIGPHELLEMAHQITDEHGTVVCAVVDRMVSRGTAARPVSAGAA